MYIFFSKKRPLLISAYIHPHNWQPRKRQIWLCIAESGQKLIEFGQCEFVCYFVSFFFFCVWDHKANTHKPCLKCRQNVYLLTVSRSLPPDIGCASLNGCKWANKNNATCRWQLPFRFRFQIFVGDSVEQSAQVHNAASTRCFCFAGAD